MTERRLFRGRTYVVQVCNLSDHLIPHEGSWIVYPNRPEVVHQRDTAVDTMKEAMTIYNNVRLVTREEFRRAK